MCFITNATIRDCPTLKKIQEICLPEVYGLDVFERLIPSTYIYVCDNQIIGYIQLGAMKNINPEAAKYTRKTDLGIDVIDVITSFAVLPEYRGKGIGRQLLAYTHANATERYILLHVRGDNPANHLYERFGFKTVCELPKYYEKPQCDGLLKVLDILNKKEEEFSYECLIHA